MTDERQVRPGFLPPRAPGAAPPPAFGRPEAPPAWAPPQPPAGPPDRPTFVAPGREAGPSSSLAVTAMVLAALSMGLLVVSAGVGYPLSALLAGIALGMGLGARRRLSAGMPGRPGQARAAIVLAGIALGLAALAAIAWLVLEASGITPEDLERWLEDELRRQRDRRDGPPGEIA